jgi:hypothetical protein
VRVSRREVRVLKEKGERVGEGMGGGGGQGMGEWGVSEWALYIRWFGHLATQNM